MLALTDWEFSHLGDPTEDWSFLLSMRGARTMPREEWLALIRDEVGVEVDADALRYWRAFNFFKGACANRSCLRGVRRRQPGAQHGADRHRRCSRRSCASWPTSSPAIGCLTLLGPAERRRILLGTGRIVSAPVTSARDLRWPDLVWSHFSRPRFGAFDERVAAAAAAGFAGIGLFAPEYERLRDEEGRTAKDIGRQLDDHGLALADIETVHGWASTGDAAAECARREELAYELADELGCRYLQAIGPYDGSVERGRRRRSARCVTGPPPTACSSASSGCRTRTSPPPPMPRRSSRRPGGQRRLLRRHLAPPTRGRRRRA